MTQTWWELLLRKTNATSRPEFTWSCITKPKPFGGKSCTVMKLNVKPLPNYDPIQVQQTSLSFCRKRMFLDKNSFWLLLLLNKKYLKKTSPCVRLWSFTRDWMWKMHVGEFIQRALNISILSTISQKEHPGQYLGCLPS